MKLRSFFSIPTKKEIDPFKDQYVFSYEKNQYGGEKVGSATMKVPRDCDFIKNCLQESRTADRNNLQWGQIGPKLIDRKVKEHHLEHFVLPSSCFYPVNYWEKDQAINSEISPSKVAEIQSKAYAIHLWNEMWRRERLTGNFLNRMVKRFTHHKNRLYARNTLLGQLQRKYL